MQNIGLLLPRSPYYQAIGFELVAGFKAALNASGVSDIRLVTDSIGFGTDKQQVYRAAENMLMNEDTGIIFAYAGMRTAQILRPLFMSANKLLVILDAGASLPQEWPVSPNILYLSLHNALGSRLSSIRAANDGFKNAGMLTNYYDGGYLHTLALTEGFTDRGGTMQFNIATGYKRDEFKLEPLRELAGKFPDACFLNIFSGDYAEWYFNDTKSIFASGTPAAYASPFMLEEGMLSRSPYNGGSTKGIAAWSKNLDNQINHKFLQAMNEIGRDATLFSLLGWEAAEISAAAIENMSKNKKDGINTGEAIKASVFDTPRGELQFHQAFNTSLSPMYEAELIAADSGNNSLKITGVVNDVKAEFESLSARDLAENVSGWFNSYTCC